MSESNIHTDPLFNQSLEKGLKVLTAFRGEHSQMTLQDVAEVASLNKSSAQRMVHTLVGLGYLHKSGTTKRYQLTLKSLELAHNYVEANQLIKAANPFLAELSNATGETANLTERDDLEMVYVARFVASKFIPIHMPIGSRVPLYCTSSGRAFLSTLDESEAKQILERSPRIAHTQHTATDIDQLMALIATARRNGYAVNNEELFLGDMTIAAPIRGRNGRAVACVHVVAPTRRWTVEDACRVLAPSLLDCVRGIGTQIGAPNKK